MHPHNAFQTELPLCNQSRGSGALISPGRGKDTDGLVVAREAVDTGLDENEAAAIIRERKSRLATPQHVQLGVLVLAIG